MKWMVIAMAALLTACAQDSGTPADRASAPVTRKPLPNVTEPVVTDAWVRQVSPGMRTTAAYLQFHNLGSEPVVIVGAESPLFQSVQIHGALTAEAVTRMRTIDSIPVAPGETVVFDASGLHIMLMQATADIPETGAIDLNLVFANGQRLAFSAPVGQPAE